MTEIFSDDRDLIHKFEIGFRELTGALQPYPWQVELFRKILIGNWPTSLNIPTGLGKTSVMAVWLLSHMIRVKEPCPPRRLVYVVNRRTIVDQATTVAEQLQGRIRESQYLLNLWKPRFGELNLKVSTLRGAHADNRQWLEDPSCPAIIVGTVDMIGSRLLFSGYGVGRWRKAQHAGLLGFDALVVHDEVHLSMPFQQLLQWVVTKQQLCCDNPRKFRVLSMSATSGCEVTEDPDTLGITEADMKLNTVQRRMHAVKRLHFHEIKDGLVDKLVELALAHSDSCSRVIVFISNPEDASKVYDLLLSRGILSENLALLTGTIRGYERDRLVTTKVLRSLLGVTEIDRSVFLISTSAGEIGADFDADHGVCDISSLDAMIQRFGRINRTGGDEREAKVDIVKLIKEDNPSKKKDLNGWPLAVKNTGEFFSECSKRSEEPVNASPFNVMSWKEDPKFHEACLPDPRWRKPHDVILDAWTLTSIQESWALARDVHPYLHGLDSSEGDDTYLAWRSELEYLNLDNPGAVKSVEVILQKHRILPQELLRQKTSTVMRYVRELHDRELLDCPVVIVRGQDVELVKPSELVNDSDDNLYARIRYATLIFDPRVGGLNDKGMLSKVGEGNVIDVADISDEVVLGRARVVLERDEDGYWFGHQLPRSIDRVVVQDVAGPTEGCLEWTEARDSWREWLKLRCLGSYMMRYDEERQPVCILLLYRHCDTGCAFAPLNSVTVEEHNAQVGARVRHIVDSLSLEEPEASALEDAGMRHDIGKSWNAAQGIWQRAIGNLDEARSLAKSGESLMNPTVLAGYRHELGSLQQMLDDPDFLEVEEGKRDLILHLVAAHHGRARPHFGGRASQCLDDFPEELADIEVARRFVRLQQRYGPWRLAWLETILMAADAEVSAGQSLESAEDEG